jgi:hypothetical protein
MHVNREISSTPWSDDQGRSAKAINHNSDVYVPEKHFPSYAPELNPDEGVWSLANGDLANSCPKDVEELMEDVLGAVEEIRNCPEKLRGCIAQSELAFLLH